MAKKQIFFVTGTDTDVGKTFSSVQLLKAFEQKGFKTLALKPVAAGCEMVDGELCNDDALKLQAAMTESLDYQQINPIALGAAIAPHVAAAQEGRTLRAERIVGLIRGALMSSSADVVLIEGAGGWLVPLNDRETLADVACKLQVPIIMVVGIRLGCLNHALLTESSILASGLPLAGWVANCIDPAADCVKENIDSLKTRLHGPCLGVFPYASTPESQDLTGCLDIDLLLNCQF